MEDGGSGGAPSPVIIPPPILSTDPCAQAKVLAADDPFKSKMTDLQSKTGLTKEVGYIIDHAGNYITVEGDAGAASIALSPAGPIDSYIHTHYDGLFPTFSGSDVIAIYDLQQANKIVDIKTSTAGVVTADGTSYLMKIDDPVKFATFSSANFSTTASFESFELLYSTSQLAYTLTGKSNVVTYELALLAALENSGITILKGNNTFSSWDTLTKTSGEMMTDKIIVTNCN